MTRKHGTAIEWTHAAGYKGETWNPVTGCDKVSPGCANCYAATFAERWRGIPGHPYEQGFDLRLWPERLKTPLRWQKPRMVFVNSMSDLFHEDVPDEFIADVFAVMANAPRHRFLVLTKRPERMRDLIRSWRWHRLVSRRMGEVMDGKPANGWAYIAWSDDDCLDNVWLGVSIENRRFVHRADVLRETPAAVRFISAEPLLGPLVPDGDHDDDGDEAPYAVELRHWSDDYEGPALNLTDIDWLIVGGESAGPAHRSLVGERRMVGTEWVRDLKDACIATGDLCTDCAGGGVAMDERTGFWKLDTPCSTCGGRRRIGGTSFFLKQWGGARPKSNGRELDGETWDEMPAALDADAAALERVA